MITYFLYLCLYKTISRFQFYRPICFSLPILNFIETVRNKANAVKVNAVKPVKTESLLKRKVPQSRRNECNTVSTNGAYDKTENLSKTREVTSIRPLSDIGSNLVHVPNIRLKPNIRFSIRPKPNSTVRVEYPIYTLKVFNLKIHINHV